MNHFPCLRFLTIMSCIDLRQTPFLYSILCMTNSRYCSCISVLRFYVIHFCCFLFSFYMQPITLLLESVAAKDMSCLIAGYCRLFVHPNLNIFPWEEDNKKHRVSAEEGVKNRTAKCLISIKCAINRRDFCSVQATCLGAAVTPITPQTRTRRSPARPGTRSPATASDRRLTRTEGSERTETGRDTGLTKTKERGCVWIRGKKSTMTLKKKSAR